MFILSLLFSVVFIIVFGCADLERNNPFDHGTDLNAYLSFGTLEYGGQTYKTIVIGTQTWMAENLNYETADSYCYENNNANCNKYGRLYTWNAAMVACPNGWHLPNDDDWEELVEYVDSPTIGVGTILKAEEGWSDNTGTNDYGFSALPGGYRYTHGTFFFVGSDGYWWSATDRFSGTANYCTMDYHSNIDFSFNVKNFGYSVRCVKD